MIKYGCISLHGENIIKYNGFGIDPIRSFKQVILQSPLGIASAKPGTIITMGSPWSGNTNFKVGGVDAVAGSELVLSVLKSLYYEGWDCISVIHSKADPV